MSITIKDIANKLDISVTSVSKALNDRDDISEKLKEKVKRVAKDLDYSPNTIAQRLVNKKSNTIGVFVLSRQPEKKIKEEENFGFKFLTGILEESNKRGYDILLFSTNSDLIEDKSYIKLCKERKVEGVVFTGLRLDDPHLEEISKSEIPIAIIDTYIEGENVGCITTDNKFGVNQALDYLWSLGHRKIAMVNGHKEAQISMTRLKYYKKYLNRKNCYNKNLVFEGDFTMESGYSCAQKIIDLERGNRPTAIFAASDLMAIGIIKAFKDKGIKVPEDVSIVGFDNIFTGEYIRPSLTTISQNAIEMGEKTIEWITDDSIRSNKKIYLEPSLIIRESCKNIK
ncbi:MAG: LacI family transcriptional regulator [Halanaerobiales bacterium]|nr:LacI family transcriptional regulator [Halanaerobiales bacterium]